MDPKEENKEENKTEEQKQEADQFGVNLDDEGKEAVTEEKKDDEEVTDDEVNKIFKESVENNDVVVELKNKLAEYSKNFKGQRDIIAKLENKVNELSTTKENTAVEELFSDIKSSKELTSDERDEMTDTEIALLDKTAMMQTAMNKMFQTMSEKNKVGETEKVENLNYSSRSEATRLATEAIKTNPTLAGDASELTDKILLEFKEFNNDQITPDVLVTRMAKALNNVKGYIPPKEQESVPTGGTNAVKANGVNEKDPFGNEIIVQEANKNNDGNYQL